MSVELRTTSLIAGMKWAQGKSKPHWLVRLYPDVIRLKDKDGVVCAWKRNAPGSPEFIEVVWPI